MAVIPCALIGEADAARCAMKQACPEMRFEILDLNGNGGRRHPQGVGGVSEAAFLDHFDEDTHALQLIHRSNAPTIVRNLLKDSSHLSKVST